MKKIPLSIQLIALGYLLTPVTFVLQYFYFSQVPFFSSDSWGLLMTPYKLSFLVIPLFIAFGIYRVHVWGWYLAMAHLAYITLNNGVALYVGSKTPIWAIIVFSIATLFVLVVFVRKEVREPYFNPRIRWWEVKPRYAITLQVEAHSEKKEIKGETFNISESGLFMVSESEVAIDEKYELKLSRNEKPPVSCYGMVVWVNPEGSDLPKGFGVKFTKPDKSFLKEIKQYIAEQKEILQKDPLYR